MKSRATVAFAAKQPLEIVELDLDCLDSKGLFPAVLGHEGAGLCVRSTQ